MTINLSNLAPPKGKRQGKKRLGRGESSGLGKTSGKGNKGQNARTGGHKHHRAFQGGQMPYVRRMPKHGFTNIFRIPTAGINLTELARFADQSEIGVEDFKAAGLMKGKDRVKILGTGELTAALTVRAHAFSACARQKIEAAGGKAEVV
jgi:large subunit ribosomal protein L15